MDEAAKLGKDTEWWIKSDGCDVVRGLTESVISKWSGDVDLGNGALQKQYDTYLKRIDVVKGLTRQLTDPNEKRATLVDIQSMQDSLKDDVTFLSSGELNNFISVVKVIAVE